MKRVFSGFMLIMLLLGMPQAWFNPFEAEAPSNHPVHNLDTGLNYTTIQEAIDTPETLDGHVILVEKGVYFEHVLLDKSLSLLGENRYDAMIDGNGTGTVLSIRANNTRISNFGIQNGSIGIEIGTDSTWQHLICENNTITQNLVLSCTVGTLLHSDPFFLNERNTLEDNMAENCSLGMSINIVNGSFENNTMTGNTIGLILYSSQSTVRENKIEGNTYNAGIGVSEDVDESNTVDGKPVICLVNRSDLVVDSSTFPSIGYLSLVDCNNITVRNATISKNLEGMRLAGCTNCTIEENTVQDNVWAIKAAHVNSTLFRMNNVSNNCNGFYLYGGFYNGICSNIITQNTYRRLGGDFSLVHLFYTLGYQVEEILRYSSGVFLRSGNNTIADNLLEDNEHGILLSAASFNTFQNNSMTHNIYNFGVDPSAPLYPPEWVINPPATPTISPFLTNYVETSNLVNGKPIYWWINRQGEQVPTDAGYIALINSTDMVIKELALHNNTQGMLLVGLRESLITNNTVRDTRIGIQMYPGFPSTSSVSINDNIILNNITNNGIGIKAISTNSTYSSNYLAFNTIGIYLVGSKDFNVIEENTIVGNDFPPIEEWILGYPPHFVNDMGYFGLGCGIWLESSNNTVRGNSIEENGFGICLSFLYAGLGNNTIYNNNFVSNEEQCMLVHSKPLPYNEWSYEGEGNYWSNYVGIDPDKDGIGNSEFLVDPQIPQNNIDHYPLMGIFSDFNATSEYNVQTVCNSTVSDFQFNGTAIRFNVVGENGTSGFCRICVPTALMDVTYKVLINSTEVTYSLLPCSNSTHSYLYFNYTHSTQEVIIIPEFSLFLILPLCMTVTLLAMAVCRRRKRVFFKSAVSAG